MSEQEADVMTVLQKMQQQLVYLEKKLDTLLQQTQQKPFNRDMNSSRPFRPSFRRPDRPGQGYGQSHGPNRGHGQRHGHEQGQGQSQNQQGEHGNYAAKKKPYKPYFGRPKER